MNVINKQETDFIKITKYHQEIFNFMLKEGYNPIRIIEDNNEVGKLQKYQIVIKAQFSTIPFLLRFSQDGKIVSLNIEKNCEELLDFLIEKINKGTSANAICSYFINQIKYNLNRSFLSTEKSHKVAEFSFDESKGLSRIKVLRSGNSYETFSNDDMVVTNLQDYTNYENKLNQVRKRYQNTAVLTKNQ